MKRLVLFIVAVLLLTGCTGQNEPDASVSTTTEPAPTGAYMPNSAPEQQTGGAVRAYGITGSRVLPLENGIAVLDALGNLVVMDTEDGVIRTTHTGITDLRGVSGNSVFYYDTDVHEYNLLTAQTSTWTLPEHIAGDFAIGVQTREIYYCTDGAIYAKHMDTGIARLLKQHSYTQQSILGAYFGGRVIAWETEAGVDYLSTENGLTLQKEDRIIALHSNADSYLALRMDGIAEQRIAGKLDGQPMQLNVDAMLYAPAFAQNGVVTADVDQGLQLAFYDLRSGKKTAAATIAEEDHCIGLMADGQYVWILTENALYRWDITKSSVTDETVYVGTVWTAENPDTEGMAQNMERINGLAQSYGIQLHIGKEALEKAGTLDIAPEHQVQAITMMLDELEPCLQLLPEGFLKSIVKNGVVHICLVRSVPSAAGYARFWSSGDCYIALALGSDLREAFLSGLGGAVDSDILGNSRDLEYWNKQNPKGFTYTYGGEMPEDYAQYISVNFADAISMTYPSEDRARVFYYAIMEGNGELFAQQAMQNKLKMLCEGIRETYDLKKCTEVLPWEQYLEKSLAYVEK